MTPADIAADVDATIRYWRTRGVLCADVAADLCGQLNVPVRRHVGWAAVRALMIAIMLDAEAAAPPLRRAA